MEKSFQLHHILFQNPLLKLATLLHIDTLYINLYDWEFDRHYRYIYKNYKLPIRGEAAIGLTVASPSPSVAMAATYQANMPPLEIPNCKVGYGVSNPRVNFLIDFITKMSIEYASRN